MSESNAGSDGKKARPDRGGDDSAVPRRGDVVRADAEETLTDPAGRDGDDPTVPADPDAAVRSNTSRGRAAPYSGGSSGASSRFKLGSLIGEGGMATVVEAEDTHLDRIVAVKAIKSELNDNRDLRERFLEEAKIQAGLTHPGTVPVHDTGALPGGKLFYAMERVSGKTLNDLLRGRSPEQVRERHSTIHLVDIFERVCQTMAYAHSRDIIHRDLKPGNIMVDDYGAVFVMDWGLAKRISRDGDPNDARTKVGVVMGTPGFMSPEQSRGLAGAGDCQTDVFALGVILYRILTGDRPFAGSSSEAVAKEVLFHHPDSPVQLNPRCGRELSAICMKSLEKDPRKRYANAGELAEDIRRFRELRPVSAIRPRLIDHVFNWIQRRKVLAAMLGTLLFVVLVGSAFVGVQAYNERQLLERGFARVDQLRAEIDAMGADFSTVREQIAALESVGASTHAQELRLQELDAGLTVKHWQLREVLMAIIGRTIFSPDDRALELAREQTLHLIDVLVEDEDLSTAQAFLASTVEHAEGPNLLSFSPEEIDAMRGRLARIESRIAAAPAAP